MNEGWWLKRLKTLGYTAPVALEEMAHALAKCCCQHHKPGPSPDDDRLSIASVALRMIADGGDAVVLAKTALAAIERLAR